MPRFTQIAAGIFQWTDTCNVYVIRDKDAALLIDLGDGSVLDHLSEIGVKSVEWVLFTHHHREQCQGGAKLKETGAKVATSLIEKPFLENPLSFRKMRPTLGDPFTVYGASFVRPPTEAIKVDHTFAKMDDFSAGAAASSGSLKLREIRRAIQHTYCATPATGSPSPAT